MVITGVMLLFGVIAACTSGTGELIETAPPPATVEPTATSFPPTPTPLSYVNTQVGGGQTSLRCEECRAVQVIEIAGPETVITEEGPYRLYGVFVAPQEQNCIDSATERLTQLVSMTVRVEEGPQDTDSDGTPIRYLYTESGDSLDELFIIEGIARNSSFDGPHSPWLLITADKARRDRNGCIWENYNRLFPQRTPRPSGGLN